jgi:PAS domain S-box-containing protein
MDDGHDDALHLRRIAMRDYSWSDLVRMGLLCIIYVSTAALGLSLDAVSGIATVVWPPTGIALAALTLYGMRLWPGIAVGALLVNSWAGAPTFAASGVAVGNTLEALLGAFLLRRVVRFRPALDRLRDVLGLVILAAGLSPLVSATIGVTSGWLGGVIPRASYGQAWWTWWLGDAMGALIVAPIVCVWSSWPRHRLPRRQLVEAGALLLAVGVVSLTVFGGLWTAPSLEVSYLVFPVLTWAALRFGPPGVVAALGLVSVVAIGGTVQGVGPFTRETLHASLLWLQAFMGIATSTSLVLAAAVAERKSAEAQQAHLYQDAQEACATAEESLALLDMLLAAAPVGFAFMDPDLRYRRINEALAAINGLPPAAHLGRTLREVVPALTPILEPLHRQVLETGKPLVNVDLCGEKPTVPREQGHWLGSYYPVRTRDGRLLGVGVVVIDVTEHRRAEEARAQLAAIVASSHDAIIGETLKGVITSWNAGAERLYGYTAKEVIGRPISLLVPPERSDELAAIQGRLRKGEHLRHIETVRVRKDGKRIDVSLCISPIKDANGRLLGTAIIARDITERRQMETYLKTSLREKEMLIKEIHHRVKNNLQVISSLLGLQARTIADPRLRAPLEESQARIQTMALIHQQLYRSGNLAQIDFAEYLRDLATRVVRSSRIGQGHVSLEICAEEVYFPIETAIPCGLLLHELLSNCVKHAFPGGRSGTIRVTLCRQPQGTHELTVRDDGVGLPEGLDVRATVSLGLRLVHLLAAQLHGMLTFESRQGTTVTLAFGEPPSHVSN